MAAQMLKGKGFSEVVNLSGGIKAWQGSRAFFGEEKGLELFSGAEALDQVLIVAYSLEGGLRDFYLSMTGKTANAGVQTLFRNLSEIEVKHQDRIFQRYLQTADEKISRQEFESKRVESAVEGGLSTQEYVDLFNPDWDSEVEIIELAMSIEAQALDLYFRASDRSDDMEGRKFFVQIADEEQAHLQQLGKLMDAVVSEGA